MNNANLPCYKLATTSFHAIRHSKPFEGRRFSVTTAATDGRAIQSSQQAAKQLEDKYLDEIMDQTDDISLARHFMQLHPENAFTVVRSCPDVGVLLNGKGIVSSIATLRLEASHYLPKVPASHRCRQLHGHSYVLQYLLPTGTEKELLPQIHQLQRKLDLSCLNDVAGLDNPTCELFAAWLWRNTPGLRGISVRETPTSGCFHDGQNFLIWRDLRMESAVKTTKTCYGHSYRARLYMQLPLDKEMGWLIDFGEIKRIISPVQEMLDHHLLSELPGLEENTDEALPHWLYNKLKSVLPSLVRLELEATPGTAALLCESDPAAIPPADYTIR